MTGKIAKSQPLTGSVGQVPSKLQAIFRNQNPSNKILWMGEANHGYEMNAVVTDKLFSLADMPQGMGTLYNFLGGCPATVPGTDYVYSAVVEFEDVLLISGSEDFYLRGRDPASGTDVYARVAVTKTDTYQATMDELFDLSAKAQTEKESMGSFLAAHRLGELVQPGDIVFLQFQANGQGSNPNSMKWTVPVDDRGVLIVGSLRIERFEQADAISALFHPASGQAATGGATGVDPDFISEDKTVADVTRPTTVGKVLRKPLGQVPSDLQKLFQSKSPGCKLLYVGKSNRGGEMNAVVTDKHFHGLGNPQEAYVLLNYLGGERAFDDPQNLGDAMGEFRDVIPIPGSKDFYVRVEDPTTDKDYYGRVIADSPSTYLYTYVAMFNLQTPDQDPAALNTTMKDFLRAHSLGQLVQPGDIILTSYGGTLYGGNPQTGTGMRFKPYLDGKGIPIVQNFWVQRFKGADQIEAFFR